MGKVNLDRYGTSRPKLIVEDLEGGDAIVLTIHSFSEETLNDNVEGERISPLLNFEETGDKVHWLNKTQMQYLVEGLGDETDDWEGKKIPLEVTETTFNGKRFKKLWVAAPERWPEYKGEGVKPPKAKPIIAKATPEKKAAPRGIKRKTAKK